nr:MAG TPA: endosialidase chaperone [Bacteriophage sp.]
MSTNLITGYAGKSHITSAGDGAVNAAVLGNGRYVLDIAEKFAYELISNNQIRIKSGYAVDQGRKIELAVNDYEELTIDNGLQGVKRCDLIAITYEKNLETGIETATMNIIKGTSGDDYTDPEYTAGDIIAGDIKDDFLLYRLKLNGISVEAVEPLFEVRKSVVKMDSSENTTAFSMASARENLESGEKHNILFGKIAKWFADLKEVAFTGKIPWADVTGKPSTYTPASHTHDNQYYKKEESDVLLTKLMQSLIKCDEDVKVELIGGYTTADSGLNNRITAVVNELKKYLPLSGGSLTGELKIKGGVEVVNGGFLSDNNIKIINNKWFNTYNTSGTEIRLLGMNNSDNIHMGNYTAGNFSPVYLHARDKQYNFTDDSFCPNVTNDVPLGLASKLWKTVYAKTGTINTSDRNKKHDIKDLTEVYEQLFLKLQPKSFIFNDGDRVHIGAISQDVETAMQELGIEAKQFAGFCKDIRYEYTEFSEEDGMPIESSKVPCKDEDGNIIYDYALRYQEFIFLTVHMVQRLWSRLDAIEKENAKIKEQIKSMQQDIEELKKVRA